MMRTQI